MLISFVCSILAFLHLLVTTHGSCSFSSGDYSVDLSELSSSEISDDYQGFVYDLTLCRNALDCSGATGTFTGTATQTKSDNCNLLGKYDSSSSAKYNSGSKTWTLKFYHGTRYKCNDNITRTLDLQLHCNSSETIKSTSITNPSSCVYQWDIQTKYVCDTTYNGPLLSVGSIILIVFGCVIILYCIIGYVINGRRSGEWGAVKSNVPQFSFWCSLLPKLTWAGCVVSKDWIRAKYLASKGEAPGNEFESINDDDDN